MDSMDDAFNKHLGDGADPQLAPPGQQTMDLAMSQLNEMHSCQILEKVSITEVMSALVAGQFADGDGQELEMPNKYKVLNDRGENAFFVVETTDCCTRNLKGQCNDCAAWDVGMHVYNGSGQAEKAFTLERPWTCTCCCFNRPTVTIHDASTGDVVATVADPYNCCDMTFNVEDKDGHELMSVKGGCCQLGLFCPLPCGPCSEVHFTAEDSSGNEIGSITKKVPSCLKFMVADDVDNYHLDFQGMNDPIEKLVLMVISIFIDFRYFSQNSNADGSEE